MQITIPDEAIQEQLTEKLAEIVLKRVDERLNLQNRASELPPYPNKKEVKEILGIGDEKLSAWLGDGLPIINWGGREQRIDRRDIEQYISKLKYTI
ncbi:hypothetical protein [Melissococcus plutonius]|uniref:hypothetical protein n=1 Tax=Melissococcus plutonius TaxID=33970 RepID=UPI003EE54493